MGFTYTESNNRLNEHGGNVRHLAKRFGIDISACIDFSSNINPYGPPEGVMAAVRRAVDTVGDYPEQQAESFVEAVAQSHGLDTESIVAGNGSIELIYLLPHAVNASRALLIVPSFTEYELALRRTGVHIDYERAMTAGEALGALARTSECAGMVFIGNPNNPCGYMVEKGALLELIDSRPGCLWVIDEAFIDFTRGGDECSLVTEVQGRNNLAVLRSLTKMYAIAGLRLGYLAAPPEVAGRVREEKYPWSVNAIALAAGVAAVRETSFVRSSAALLRDEAHRLYHSLSEIDGLMAYEPSANYILIKIEGDATASYVQERLLGSGVAIRDCSSYTGMDDRHFRVAVKRPEDNDRLLDALGDVFA